MYKIIITIFLSLFLTGCSMDVNRENEENINIPENTVMFKDINNMTELEKTTDIQGSVEKNNENNKISVWDIPSDKRQAIIEQYEKSNQISYKNKMERFNNPYFFSIDQEEQDIFVRFLDMSSVNNYYQQNETHITVDYLFSFESGDIYVLWYPPIQYSETLSTKNENNLLGYFYVNEEVIIEIRNLSVDNKSISIFEFTEENVFNLEYSHPVSYANFSLKIIEKYIFDDNKFNLEWFEKYGVANFYIPDADREIMVSSREEYVITDIRTVNADNNRYSRYVWKKEEGLVGYQYGQGVGGGQHDFFIHEDILNQYLNRD